MRGNNWSQSWFRVIRGSFLSLLLFAIVVDVVTTLTKKGLLGEILNTDDLVLMSDTMDRLGRKFTRWKEAFENKSLNVNLGNGRFMVDVQG